MKRLVGLVFVCAVAAAACSASQATSNVATLDAPARQACADLQAVIQARASGTMDSGSLRAWLGKVYDEASASVNPIIKTRAVALFADATVMASGGEGTSLNADLQAMSQACGGA